MARCNIDAVVLPVEDPLIEVVKLAKSTLQVSTQPSPLLGRTLCIVRELDRVPALEELNNGMLLFLPRPTTRAQIKEWVEKLPSGLILDLYEAILVVDMPRVKYLYRTTM